MDVKNEELCRICLQNVPDPEQNICNVKLGGHLACDAINLLSDVTHSSSVHPMIKIPKRVCKPCQERVVIALELRDLILASNKRISELEVGELLFTPSMYDVGQAQIEVSESEARTTLEIVEVKGLPPLETNFEILAETLEELQEPKDIEPFNVELERDKVKFVERLTRKVASPGGSSAGNIKSAFKKGQNSNGAYTCDVCLKQFMWKSSLTIHLYCHFNIKNFKCEICQKTFLRKFSLEEHVRTHNGEKPFSCPTCKKKFRQRSHLMDHLTTHSNKLSFACGKCDAKFKTRGTTRVHIKRLHGNDVVKDSICRL